MSAVKPASPRLLGAGVNSGCTGERYFGSVRFLSHAAAEVGIVPSDFFYFYNLVWASPVYDTCRVHL